MSSWLYPISKKSGKSFELDDGTEEEVSVQNFIKLVRNGRLKEDKWWYVSKNFDKVQIGDEIYIYTGDKDLGIIGYAIVTNKDGKNRTTWKLRVNHDLEKCRMLIEKPIPAKKVRSWIPYPRAAVYSLQKFESELILLIPWGTKSTETERKIVDFAENEIAVSKKQGINISQEAKCCVENYSMNKAKKYFENLKYIVNDVSATCSYDLHCVRDDEELFVEVKGTQTEGSKILLTKNEVKNATANKGKVALYILHSIQMEKAGENCEAINGTEHVLNKWDIEKGTLIPMIYEYEIPRYK
jgi:hypothetical protein